MDLNDLTPQSDTVEVKLEHPKTGEVLTNDDGSEMTIEMYLPHTKEYKKARYKRTDAFIKKKKEAFSAQEAEEAALELLAEATASWNITFNKEQPKLTVAKARELYEKVFWIKPQLEEAVTDALDFTKV